MTNDQFSTLIKKLDILVRMMALNLTADMKKTDQIQLLGNSGLGSKEIAEVIGTTPNTVSVTLSRLRKEKK